jgi:hypothetical protein
MRTSRTLSALTISLALVFLQGSNCFKFGWGDDGGGGGDGVPVPLCTEPNSCRGNVAHLCTATWPYYTDIDCSLAANSPVNEPGGVCWGGSCGCSAPLANQTRCSGDRKQVLTCQGESTGPYYWNTTDSCFPSTSCRPDAPGGPACGGPIPDGGWPCTGAGMTGECPLEAPNCSGGVCVCPSKVICGGACVVEPYTDTRHCGATGDCTGANAGTDCIEATSSSCGMCVDTVCVDSRCGSGSCCPAGMTCSNGDCLCPSGRIYCPYRWAPVVFGSECVDPSTSLLHCGASRDCTGASAGVRCTTAQVCVNGVCVPRP